MINKLTADANESRAHCFKGALAACLCFGSLISAIIMYLLLLLSSKYCQTLKRLKRIISQGTRCAPGFCCCRSPAGASAGMNTRMELWGGEGAAEPSRAPQPGPGSSSPGTWGWKCWEICGGGPWGHGALVALAVLAEWPGSIISEGFCSLCDLLGRG